MKKIYILLYAVFVALQLSAQDHVAQIREKLMSRDSTSVIVVAHRGDWRNFPENSLEAIDNAIKMGVDIVELDVKKTKDGELILMHDRTLDRTTTGKGLVSENTLSDIRKLNLRNGCNIRTIHKVPTLEEALLHAKGKIMINLDQADLYFDQIYELMKKTGTTKQIIMKGSKPVAEVKKDLGKYLDRIIYMPIVHLDRPGAMQQIDDFMKELHPVAFELLFESDTCQFPKQVRTKLEGKSKIWYNTLWDTMAGGHDDDKSLENPDEGYGYLIDKLGATIIQTDRTAYLLEYLQARKKRNEHKIDAFH